MVALGASHVAGKRFNFDSYCDYTTSLQRETQADTTRGHHLECSHRSPAQDWDILHDRSLVCCFGSMEMESRRRRKISRRVQRHF